MKDRSVSQPTAAVAENCAIAFDKFRLVPGIGLFRGDDPVELPPKELQLLQLLISLRGRLATHELVEETVWPRQLVSYASQARCVYSLRKRLGDESRTLVATVPKRGYRLTAKVVELRSATPRPLAVPVREASLRTSPLAFSHYQAGLYSLNQPSGFSLQRALRQFEAAVLVDAEYAAAHAAIADVRMYQTQRGFLDPPGGLALGLEACEAALSIDPQLASALAVKGWFQACIQRDLAAATASLDLAEALDPTYARQYTYRCLVERARGDVAAALESSGRAVALDPHSLLNRHSHAWTLHLAGQAQAAFSIEKAVVEEYPHDEIALAFLSLLAARMDDNDTARKAADRLLALAPDAPSVWAFMAYVFALIGDLDIARALVKRAETATLPRVPLSLLVPYYFIVGDETKALDLAADAWAQGCPLVHDLKIDPRLAPLQESGKLDALSLR